MGLFKKKNAFVVADRIAITPELFFRTSRREYHIGMKVWELMEEFAFVDSWKAKEKLKPKTRVAVDFKHKETGGKLQLHLVNRGTATCRYQEAEICGVSVSYCYGGLDRSLLQFCYKLSKCNTCLDGCQGSVEIHTLLGKPGCYIAEQEYVEKIEVKSTTPRREEIEQEFDGDYYTIKTWVYDTTYEDHYIRIGDQEAWHYGDTTIRVRYEYNSSRWIEDITVETTK